ncbi:MAG: hypothetical protein GTO22_04685, partial [Gemmatimonadales bacterium]|nr:hypothetical protein [Gemmatimonadales bacterium]
MRVPIGADIGQFEIPAFIGQAPAALPVFAQMAARNSWPLKNESALFDNVGNFIVTRDGSEIARYARPVSNTVYNEFLPKPGKWIPVMYYYGAKPGGINFVPMDKFLARANVISDQVIEEVLAQMPGPMTIESPMTNAGFWDSISSGMELAQQALDEARGGNWKLASVRLNAKGAGARAYLDRANATARTLSDLGLMDYNKYVQSAILDLGGLITQATMAIGTQKAGGILAWVDAFKYVFANTIAAEAIVLEDNFVKFTNMYATAFRALVDQVATQKKLAPHVPSMGPAERKYYDESNAIILDIRKELGKMDAQLESVGINPQEFRDQAGLEGQLEGLGFWGPVIRVGSKVIGWIGTKLGFKKAAQTAASATGKKTFQEIPIIGQTAAQTAARGAAR